MNASTDLIYSTLDRQTEGFGSNQFRSEIEKLSLTELNNYIDNLLTGDWNESEHRDEKLRLCLRVRNAHLLKLPWFYTSRQHEYHTTYTSDLLKYDVLFFFLNFRSQEEVDMYKREIHSLNLKDTAVFCMMHEQCYGQAEMKVYADKELRLDYHNGPNFFIVKAEQYNHLVSRNLLQDILNLTIIGNFIAYPCVDSYDLKFIVRQGKVFFANRYPEHNEKEESNITLCLQLLLQKMGLLGRIDFTALLLIELQPNHKPDAMTIDDLNWMRNEMHIYDKNKLYLIKTNHEMDCPLRLSLVASMD